jgi:hypothetical protein
MEKPHRCQCAAKLFNAKPLRPAAFRQYRQAKYVLGHILRPSIHPKMDRWPPPNSTQRNEIARAVSRWPSFCRSKVAWIEGLHRGPRAALRGGECEEARAQVRQRRFAAAHYEGLNLLRGTESHDLLYGRTEADEPNSRCPISNLYARRCPTAPAVRANRLVIFLTGAIE